MGSRVDLSGPKASRLPPRPNLKGAQACFTLLRGSGVGLARALLWGIGSGLEGALWGSGVGLVRLYAGLSESWMGCECVLGRTVDGL